MSVMLSILFQKTLIRLIWLCLGASVGVGCSSGFYKKRADREVFGILEKKSEPIADAGDALLSITPPEPVRLEELERNLKTEDFLGDRAGIERGAGKVSLADALRFSVERNRTYLGEKELVYLTALDLTLTRQQFSPILVGSGVSAFESRKVESGMNQFVTESTLTTTGNVGFSALQRTGLRLATDLTADFVKFLKGDLRSISDSSVVFAASQPLLRGAGVLAASEILTQGERDVLYAIRGFTQLRKGFAVDIATRYFQTLQARESARNTFLAYRAFTDSVEREEMLADTGVRPTRSFFYQVRQAQLSNDSRWRTAVRNYEQALDDLKVELGLPIEEPLLLDTKELDLEIIDPPGTLEEALNTALVTRLDLWNQRDALVDAGRRVRIAKQDLLPAVDASAAYRTGTEGTASNRLLGVNLGRQGVSGRLDIDPNLNQKPGRNVLRSAQIAEQRAQRELDLAEENVRSQIRTAWRDLQLARQQYDLAVQGLAISEERVKLETELLDEGQGTARDLVEAQRDLIDARNGIISAKVSHTLARLQLWRDMGVLFIQKDGMWADVLKRELPRGS